MAAGATPLKRPFHKFAGHRPDLPSQHGFTLMELIVVVLLLTILLGFAIPAFQGSVLTGSREQAVRELMSAVKKLKMAALRRQTIHSLYLDLDQNQLRVAQTNEAAGETESPAGSRWDLPGDTRIAQVRFPDNRQIRTGTVEIKFYPEGYSDRAVIQLTGGGKQPIDLVIEAFLPMALIASENGQSSF